MTGIVAVLWRSASDRCPTQKYAASLPDCSCKAPIDAIYIGQVIFARTLTMSRKRKTKRSGRIDKAEGIPVLNPNAAGLDIGANEIYAAVPVDRDAQPVQCFGTFTGELHALSAWLHQCRIETVAMEATGVYWIPAFQILETSGLEVCLVNPRYFQNVPGRRTDVSDCQWLQRLHSAGLLRGSFRPAQEVCVLRSLSRHRDNLIHLASTHILHMQKALDQMNVQPAPCSQRHHRAERPGNH